MSACTSMTGHSWPLKTRTLSGLQFQSRRNCFSDCNVRPHPALLVTAVSAVWLGIGHLTKGSAAAMTHWLT